VACGAETTAKQIIVHGLEGQMIAKQLRHLTLTQFG